MHRLVALKAKGCSLVRHTSVPVSGSNCEYQVEEDQAARAGAAEAAEVAAEVAAAKMATPARNGTRSRMGDGALTMSSIRLRTPASVHCVDG
jgi:hypothetical protein